MHAREAMPGPDIGSVPYPGLMLAMEPAEDTIMKRPPRRFQSSSPLSHVHVTLSSSVISRYQALHVHVTLSSSVQLRMTSGQQEWEAPLRKARHVELPLGLGAHRHCRPHCFHLVRPLQAFCGTLMCRVRVDLGSWASRNLRDNPKDEDDYRRTSAISSPRIDKVVHS
eukprot:2619070-Rhodomonas_salina.1